MRQGIMLNEDCNHFIATRKRIIEDVDEAYLCTFIDQYAGTHVSDFVMNIGATLSFAPSETRQFAADKAFVKEELGTPVDYSETEMRAAHHLWYEKKLDLYQIWIDRCGMHGIRPWLSFRMNDAELPEIPNHISSEYYYAHYRDQARVRHRDPKIPTDFCRDYGIPEFREYQLAYIREMLGRYDVFGIELDFQREIYCFRPGHEEEGRGIMTDFVRRVKAIVSAHEARYGHKIALSVRCHAAPALSLELGFDVPAWAEAGLVDLVIPSPNYITTDNELQIELWRALMKPYGVRVVGCLESHVNTNPAYLGVMLAHLEERGLEKHSFETLCASAMDLLSQGSDGIYLFNFMDRPDCMEERFQKFFFDPAFYQKILRLIDDREALVKARRRHLATYCDTTPPWHAVDTVFPLKFDGIPRYLRIRTGDVLSSSKATFRLAYAGDPAAVTVFVNSEKAEYTGTVPCEDPVLTERPLLCFTVPRGAVRSGVQVAEILAESGEADYADLLVEPE